MQMLWSATYIGLYLNYDTEQEFFRRTESFIRISPIMRSLFPPFHMDSTRRNLTPLWVWR